MILYTKYIMGYTGIYQVSASILLELTVYHGILREFTAQQRPLAVIDRSIPVYMCVHNMCVHTCIYPVYGVSREHIPCYVIWPHMAAYGRIGRGWPWRIKRFWQHLCLTSSFLSTCWVSPGMGGSHTGLTQYGRLSAFQGNFHILG